MRQSCNRYLLASTLCPLIWFQVHFWGDNFSIFDFLIFSLCFFISISWPSVVMAYGRPNFGQLAWPQTPLYWEPVGPFLPDYWEPWKWAVNPKVTDKQGQTQGNTKSFGQYYPFCCDWLRKTSIINRTFVLLVFWISATGFIIRLVELKLIARFLLHKK